MVASRRSRSLAVACACATFLAAGASAAITPDAAPFTVLSVGSGLCVRSPDVTFEGDSYYVVFTRGPCSGSGMFDVMIGRWNPVAPSMFAPTTVWSQSLSDARLAPTARVASGAGMITVTSVDRALAFHTIHVDFFSPTLTRPMPAAPAILSSGTVLQQSLDCGTGAMPPCVLSTIELSSGTSIPRVFAYYGVATPTPVMLGARTDAPVGVASIAGAAGQSAAAFVTNSTNMTMPHAMVATAPSATLFTLSAGTEPALNGVAAIRFASVAGAFWTVPNFLEFAVRPTWNSMMRLISGRAMLAGAQAYFSIDDGIAIGANALLVGRNSATVANGEAAPIAYVSFVPENGLAMVPVTPTSVTPKSPTRIAAGANHCPLFGTGIAVFAAGASASTDLVIHKLRCSMNSECADSAGTPGSCVANACVFPVGTPCNPLPDAGVDAGRDASLDSANIRDTGVEASTNDVVPSSDASDLDTGITPNDVVASDASASMDGGAQDGSTSSDGSVVADASTIPSVTGGACGCRAAGRDTRDVRPLVFGSLLVIAAIQRRRRRAR